MIGRGGSYYRKYIPAYCIVMSYLAYSQVKPLLAVWKVEEVVKKKEVRICLSIDLRDILKYSLKLIH